MHPIVIRCVWRWCCSHSCSVLHQLYSYSRYSGCHLVSLSYRIHFGRICQYQILKYLYFLMNCYLDDGLHIFGKTCYECVCHLYSNKQLCK
jgi:hypothetical protein